jgi:hypothetical protein
MNSLKISSIIDFAVRQRHGHPGVADIAVTASAGGDPWRAVESSDDYFGYLAGAEVGPSILGIDRVFPQKFRESRFKNVDPDRDRHVVLPPWSAPFKNTRRDSAIGL